MQIDPLGGCLDDLLVEVAKAHLLRDASRDRLTFGACEMRHADDSVRRRHLFKFMPVAPGRESPAGGYAAHSTSRTCRYARRADVKWIAALAATAFAAAGAEPSLRRRKRHDS